MDWRYHLLILLALLPLATCWIPIKPTFSRSKRQQTAVSPYIDIVLCPIRAQPWSCAREQSARILDIWDGELHSQWQKLKVEADRQLNATIEKRGYSASEVPTKEKPSTILKKIEIGTNFMKEYLAESMDGFLGHEFEYLQDDKQQLKAAEDEDEDDEDETDDEDDEEDDGDEAQDEENDEDEDDADDDEDEDEEADADESEKFNNYAQDDNDDNTHHDVAETNNHNADNDATKNQLLDGFDGEEFIEIEEPSNTVGQLKKPGDKKKNKNKIKKRFKKKKGQQQQQQHATLQAQPATLLVVQQAQPQHHESDLHHLHNDHGSEAIQLHSTPVSDAEGHGHGHGHGGNKLKDKRKKRKNKNKRKKRPGHESVSTVIVEEAPSNHLGFELLEELVGEQELLSGVGGKRKRKNKHPSNYGRSNGVTRGKKKKKKKAIAKLVLLGSFLKAKIELLLKLLGAHLQIKFFAIALIGLLINIARFWIDVKRGGVPQKVVYVEHAHHQHHYEEQGDDWGEGGGGGGYWKRSLQTDPTVGEKVEGGFTDSYQLRPQYDAQYMAYRNQWH